MKNIRENLLRFFEEQYYEPYKLHGITLGRSLRGSVKNTKNPFRVYIEQEDESCRFCYIILGRTLEASLKNMKKDIKAVD